MTGRPPHFSLPQKTPGFQLPTAKNLCWAAWAPGPLPWPEHIPVMCLYHSCWRHPEGTHRWMCSGPECCSRDRPVLPTALLPPCWVPRRGALRTQPSPAPSCFASLLRVQRRPAAESGEAAPAFRCSLSLTPITKVLPIFHVPFHLC